ncbi:MAG: hypothetical protein Q8Q09_09710 [Deltaproteobacteria bacterium]|nr:hypothetical protein [Deltaproteobacteria bacterium]
MTYRSSPATTQESVSLPLDRPWALMVGGLLSVVGVTAARVANRAWPGPLWLLAGGVAVLLSVVALVGWWRARARFLASIAPLNVGAQASQREAPRAQEDRRREAKQTRNEWLALGFGLALALTYVGYALCDFGR